MILEYENCPYSPRVVAAARVLWERLNRPERFPSFEDWGRLVERMLDAADAVERAYTDKITIE